MDSDSSRKAEYSTENLNSFDWIILKNDMDNAVKPETSTQKFMRKFKDNPFVPIGCLATVMALSYGIWNFRTGNKQMSQYMMRARVLAQGFTVFALVGGIFVGATKLK